MMRIDSKQRALYSQILIFLALTAGILIAGYLYYQSYEQEFRVGVENQLTSVGDLKVDELVRWRNERLGDARVFGNNLLFSSQVSELQNDPGNIRVTQDLLNWLSQVQSQYHYNRVFLLSPEGKMTISVPNASDPVSSTVLVEIPSVFEKREITVIDFYRDEYDQKIYLTILVPIYDPEIRTRPLGILALQIDPEEYLYPFISRWPTPSSSAETLLLRRDGDAVLYLNELRFRSDTALSYRLPLNLTDRPAVKAALGQEGIVEGVDYRGVPVIANIRKIPDSPWFMVARIDSAEVLKPLQTTAIDLTLIVLSLLFVTGAGLYLFRRRESDRVFQEKVEIQNELLDSEERLRLSLDAVNDAIWDWNVPTGTAIFSPRWYTMLGYEPGEMPPTYATWRSLLHPDDLNQTEQLIQKTIQNKAGGFTAEFRMRTKVGDWCWILARGKIIAWDTDGNPIRMVGTHSEINERKRYEQELILKDILFNSSAVANSFADNNGCITHVNAAFMQMWAFPSEDEVIGRPITDFFADSEEAVPIQEALSTAGVWRGEFLAKRADGSTFITRGDAISVRDQNGESVGFSSSNIDVTVEREYEEALKREQERLFAVLETIPAFVYLQARDYSIPFANRAFYELFGEIGGRPCYEVIQNRDSPCEECLTLDVLRTGKSAVWEWTNSDGRTFMVYDTRFPSEEKEMVLEVGIEISDLKQTQEHLKESEGTLRTLIHAIPDLVWLKDKNGIYLACNPVFERFIGVKEVDLITKSDYDFFEKELADSFREHDIRAINAGRPLVNEEWITFADDGHRSLLETIKTPMYDTEGTLIGVLGIGRDITERKSIEEQITIQNQRLEQAQAVGHLGSWEFDLRTGNIWGSNEGFRIYGMNPPQGNKLPIDEIESCIPDHERVHQALIDLIEEKSPYNLEFAIHPADGSPERTIISIAEIIKDESGTPHKVLGVIQDVTSRKQAEIEQERLISELARSNEQLGAAYEELSGSEEELRYQFNTLAATEEHLRETSEYLENLITYANVPIIVWDPVYTITRINHAFESLIGRSADAVIGSPLEALFPQEQKEHSMRLIETTRAGVRWDTIEMAIQHQDGSIRTLLWNSSTIYSTDGSTPIATIAQGQDITLRKILEREKEISLMQIQKNLAQLSILNDEIRNPLMVILMSADMIGDTKLTDTIAEQTKRIDDMVRQLDQRWVESEKVLTMIRKNYQINASSSTDHIITRVKEDELRTHASEIGDGSSSTLPRLLAEEIQAELYTILDSIDAFVFVADLQTYEILYLNRLGRSLFGDIAGKTCYQIIQKDQAGPCPFCTNHMLIDEIGPTGVHQRENKNSRNGRWYDCRDRVIRWSDGRLVHLQVATDITERKSIEDELRENEYTFRKLYEESSDPILLMQEDRFIECNQAALDMLGVSTKEEFIGSTPMDISPEIQPDGQLSAESAPEYIGRAHIEGRSRFEWMIQRIDGTPVLIEVSLFPIMFKGEEMLHITWRDITERKAMEELIRKSETELQKKLHTILSPDGNLESLNLSDIIDVSEIQLIMNDFFSLTQIGVAIVDIQGNVLVATGWQDICTRFHRVNPETAKNCVQSDIELSEGVPQGTFRLYRCKNNMWDIATPIVVGGAHVGNLFLGQFLFNDEEPDYALFCRHAQRYGFDQEAYIAALERVPRWSRETVDTVMKFYTRLLHLISEVSWGNIRLARTLTERDHLIQTVQVKNEQLEIALKKFKTLFEIFPLGISITDYSGKIIEDNAESARLLGFPRSEKINNHYIGPEWVISRPDGSLMPHEEYPWVRALKENRLIEDAEMRLVKENGVITWVSVSAAPIDLDQFGVVIVSGDITLRKQGEELLKKTNDELQSLTEELEEREEELAQQIQEIIQAKNEWEGIFQAIGNPTLILDAQHRICDANNAILTLSGKTLDELRTMQCWELFHGPSVIHPPECCPFEKMKISGKMETGEMEVEAFGEVFLVSCTPLFNADGMLDRVIHIATNISERKQTEEALIQAHEWLGITFRAAKAGAWDWDVTAGTLTWSPELFELFVLSPDTPPTFDSWLSVLHPDDRAPALATIDQSVKEHRYLWNEYRILLPDGKIRWIGAGGTASYTETGVPLRMSGVCIDITDKKLYEESLHEAVQKLRLLTGITRHDIFNQLSVVQGLQVLALETSDPKKINEYITRARQAGNQIEKTIGFTREYENFGVASSGWQRIHQIINSANGDSSPGGVTVENHIPDDLEVYADPIIRKVFTTLIENAIRHGGNISTIRFTSGKQDESFIITCEDDGVGVPSEEKGYIFDHGFGNHTGIGLFLAREILSITGLSIRECGVSGDGARFEILVPAGKFRMNPDIPDQIERNP